MVCLPVKGTHLAGRGIVVATVDSSTELSNLAVVYNGDCMHDTGVLHLGHLLPLSGEGIELHDVLNDGAVASAATAIASTAA